MPADSPSTGCRRALVPLLILWAAGALCAEGVSVGGHAAVIVIAAREWWRRGVRWRGWEYHDLALAGFMLVGLLGPAVGGAVPTGTGFVRHLDLLGVPAAAWALAAVGEAGRRTVMRWVAGVFVCSMGVAACQHFGIWPSLATLRTVLPWEQAGLHRVYEQVPGIPDRYMVGGLLLHRLKFAHTGVLAVLLLGALPWASRRWRIGVAVIGAVAVMWFPYARAAALALIVSVAATLMASVTGRRAALIAVAAGICAALAVGLNPGLRARMAQSVSSQGNGERTKLMGAGLRAMWAHPAGVGAGRFRPGDFPPPEGIDPHIARHAPKAHNQLVTVGAELGWLGLLAFCGWLGALFRYQRTHRRGGAAGLGVLTCFVVLSGVHDPLFHVPFATLFSFALGASIAEGRGDPELRQHG